MMKFAKKRIFIANTESEAVRMAKESLGSKAVIISSRKIKKGGFLGLFAKRMVEVTAGVPVEEEKKKGVDFDILAQLIARRKAEADLVPGNGSAQNNDLALQIQEMKDMIATFIEHSLPSKGGDMFFNTLPQSLKGLYSKMLENEVNEETVREIFGEFLKEIPKDDKLEDRDEIINKLLEHVSKRIPVSGPIEVNESKVPMVVVMVGPTGVGKTTTIAKLAAIYTLYERKDVALVTADTYRIAAVEQLKTYGKIIGIPVEVVFTPQEIRQAVEEHMDADLILIDTAGRSQHDEMKMSELKAYIEGAEPTETHLVLSATTKYKDLEDAVERFSCVPLDKFVFTKLDETTTFGNILNIVVKYKYPLSYITNGQNVPNDIEVADSMKIARGLLGMEVFHS